MVEPQFQFEGSDSARGRRHPLDARWWWVGVCLVIAVLSVSLIVRQSQREHRQDQVILGAALHYDMSPALIKAVVWQESRFNPKARGGAGEVGLMQISKLAAQEWAQSEGIQSFEHHQLFDAEKNTRAGTWYLKKLMRRYAHTDRPLAYALADYNAGRKNVLRWIKGPAATQSALFIDQIDFPTTRRYVISVLERYEHYSKEDSPIGAPPSS